MPKIFRLSWVAKLKQWRKRKKVNGVTKTFYLGTGKGRDDRESYARALAKWKQIERKIDEQDEGTKLFRQFEAWRSSLSSRPTVDATPYVVQAESQVDQSKPLPSSMERWMEGTARFGEDRPLAAAPSNKGAGKTLGQWVDEYIAEQQRRYEHGLRFPEAPQNERISGVRLMSYRYNAGLLKTEWLSDPLPKDEETFARVMKRFRESQKALMSAGTIQPGTFNERIKTLRHVVGWLHDQYLIPNLPRQTSTICSMYPVKTTAKALDVETIRLLWREASPRLKTYIALALNCGFYVVDIANLEFRHIQDDYIICDRHKTGVPARFKLWAVTKRLLAENCNGKDRLALVTEDGGPLYVINPAANKGKGTRWCKIETDLLALTKRLKIKGVTCSRFRDTTSTKIESIDRSLTDLFEAHKDRRMARFYIDGDKIDYDRRFAGLDKAMDELEIYYGLTLPDQNGDRENPAA